MDGRLIIVLFIFLAIAGLVAVVSRLIRVGVTLLALAIILPILCTVLWGDGSSYVSKFASIFTPEIEQRITEGYQFYKEQDSKDPVLDYEQVEREGRWRYPDLWSGRMACPGLDYFRGGLRGPVPSHPSGTCLYHRAGSRAGHCPAVCLFQEGRVDAGSVSGLAYEV